MECAQILLQDIERTVRENRLFVRERTPFDYSTLLSVQSLNFKPIYLADDRSLANNPADAIY